MQDQPLLSDPAKINEFVRSLDRLRCVSRYNTKEETEAGTLAHNFSDLEQSFRKFLTDLLPKLARPEISEQEAEDILHSIGEEFRHINYHLRDSKFYEYLW